MKKNQNDQAASYNKLFSTMTGRGQTKHCSIAEAFFLIHEYTESRKIMAITKTLIPKKGI